LGSQTVLLKGINDKPYVDEEAGSRASQDPGFDLTTSTSVISSWERNTSGRLWRRAPDDGKASRPTRPATPCPRTWSTPPRRRQDPSGARLLVSRSKGKVVLRNYEGKTFEYPEPNIIEFKKARPARRRKWWRRSDGMSEGTEMSGDGTKVVSSLQSP